MSAENMQIEFDEEESYFSNLPPLERRDLQDGAHSGASGGEEGTETDEPEFEKLSIDQVANLVRWSYVIGGMKTGYKDIWAAEEEFVYDVARRIEPDVNHFRIVAMLLGKADQKSGWAMYAFDIANRVRLSRQRMKEEQEQNGEQPTGNTNEPADGKPGHRIIEPGAYNGSR